MLNQSISRSVNCKMKYLKKAHCCTLAPLGYTSLGCLGNNGHVPQTQGYPQQRPSVKVIIKIIVPQCPSMSLEFPTRNDLVPRCCLRIYDGNPFELPRYPYMLPSMTITITRACPSYIQRQGYLLTNSRITLSNEKEENNDLQSKVDSSQMLAQN